MYDWANSAFATTVMAGFFPIFFKQYWSYGADVNVSTAQLGFGNSIASLLVAMMAPILGAIADKGSAKKKFLVFVILCFRDKTLSSLNVKNSVDCQFIGNLDWRPGCADEAVAPSGKRFPAWH